MYITESEGKAIQSLIGKTPRPTKTLTDLDARISEGLKAPKSKKQKAKSATPTP